MRMNFASLWTAAQWALVKLNNIDSGRLSVQISSKVRWQVNAPASIANQLLRMRQQQKQEVTNPRFILILTRTLLTRRLLTRTTLLTRRLLVDYSHITRRLLTRRLLVYYSHITRRLLTRRLLVKWILTGIERLRFGRPLYILGVDLFIQQQNVFVRFCETFCFVSGFKLSG